jgi:hypothetical protein
MICSPQSWMLLLYARRPSTHPPPISLSPDCPRTATGRLGVGTGITAGPAQAETTLPLFIPSLAPPRSMASHSPSPSLDGPLSCFRSLRPSPPNTHILRALNSLGHSLPARHLPRAPPRPLVSHSIHNLHASAWPPSLRPRPPSPFSGHPSFALAHSRARFFRLAPRLVCRSRAGKNVPSVLCYTPPSFSLLALLAICLLLFFLARAVVPIPSRFFASFPTSSPCPPLDISPPPASHIPLSVASSLRPFGARSARSFELQLGPAEPPLPFHALTLARSTSSSFRSSRSFASFPETSTPLAPTHARSLSTSHIFCSLVAPSFHSLHRWPYLRFGPHAPAAPTPRPPQFVIVLPFPLVNSVS